MNIKPKDYDWALTISEKGRTVILKRTLKERFVNNYNPHFILAWQANMDIQFCTDIYAVVTYITDYLTKGESKFEKLLEAAMKNNSDCDDFQRLNNLKRIYFEYRQICASEAVQRLLPTLKVKSIRTLYMAIKLP